MTSIRTFIDLVESAGRESVLMEIRKLPPGACIRVSDRARVAECHALQEGVVS